MSASLTSALLLGAALGARHGLDADHLAAIDGLSRLHADRPLLARSSGLLFSTGYSAIVITAAMALGSSSRRVPDWLEGTGSLVSIGLLLLLGGANLLEALRSDDRGRRPGALASLLLRLWPAGGALGSLAVGAMFALSFDTLTIAAWIGGTSLGIGAEVSALLLGLSFAAGMVACDTLNGLWVARLIARSQAFAQQTRRAFAGLVATISLAVAAIGIARLGSAGIDWLAAGSLWTSVAMLIALTAGFRWLQHLHAAAGPSTRGVDASACPGR